MRRTFSLGRLFGTDIEASLDFFLMIAYVLFVMADSLSFGAMIAMTFLVSILFHEFGHVFAVRRRLQVPCRVILWAFGGLCVYPRLGTQARAKDDLFISLMGPAFGLALAGVAWLALSYAPISSPLALTFLHFFFWFNLVVNLANLLPIFPLDGGQALRAILTERQGPSTAAETTRRVSIAVGAIAALAAFRFGYQIGAIIAVMLVVQNLMGSPTAQR